MKDQVSDLAAQFRQDGTRTHQGRAKTNGRQILNHAVLCFATGFILVVFRRLHHVSFPLKISSRYLSSNSNVVQKPIPTGVNPAADSNSLS